MVKVGESLTDRIKKVKKKKMVLKVVQRFL